MKEPYFCTKMESVKLIINEVEILESHEYGSSHFASDMMG